MSIINVIKMPIDKKLRILHVINEIGIGGAEILVMESMPLYNLKEVQADLLVLIPRDTDSFIREMKKEKLFEVITLDVNSFYNILIPFKLMRYLRKYDVIHVHLFPSLYWVALSKMLSFSSVKLVFTEHSTFNNRMKYKIFRVLDRFIYSFYAKIITISNDVDAALKKHLALKDSKFELINNGINLKKIYNAVAYPATQFFPGANENTKIVIQVAGFKGLKDQDTLIKAIALLPHDVKLLLVGNGDKLQGSMDLVTSLNLQDRVSFLGARKDVPSLLKTADIVVLSSAFEGLSLSSVEGMASGSPFIASDVVGLTDVVKDAGLLFPLGDETKLAVFISQLINDPSFYKKTVLTCIERSKEYDIERMIDRQIELYKSII